MCCDLKSIYLSIYLSISKGLTCTFRASCYSARLSWALVLTWVSPFVQDKKSLVGFGERIGDLVTTFALKEHYDLQGCLFTKIHCYHVD